MNPRVTLHMANGSKIVMELLERTEKVFFEQKDEAKEEVLRLEDKLDRLETAIRGYASDIMQTGLDGKDADMLEACVVSAGDLERIGDHATNIAEWVEFAATGYYKGREVL